MKKLFLQQKSRLMAIADQGIVSGTNFMTGLLITRVCGAETYGEYALYWMIFLFFQGLSNAFIGLPAQVISNQRINKIAYLEFNNQMGLMLMALLLPLLYLGFGIYHLLFQASFGWGYWLFPLVIVLFLKHEMNRKYFYAKDELNKVMLIDSVTYFGFVPTFFILGQANALNLNSIVCSMLCFALVGQSVFQLIKTKNPNLFAFKKLPFHTNWNYAKALITTAILQWFTGNLFLILAGSILGVGAVGIVRILQNVLGVLHVLFLTLENVLPAKAAYLFHHHGKKQVLTYFRKVLLVTGSVYVIILALVYIFGADLLDFLYGNVYRGYGSLLQLFTFVYLFVFLGTLAQIAIKSLHLNHGILKAYIISVGATLALAYPLLSFFQIKGIIIGFGLLQIITLSVYLLTLKKAIL